MNRIRETEILRPNINGFIMDLKEAVERLRKGEICSVVRENELIISQILRASMKISKEAAIVRFHLHFLG